MKTYVVDARYYIAANDVDELDTILKNTGISENEYCGGYEIVRTEDDDGTVNVINAVTLNKVDVANLLGYIETLLNFIDVEDFEDDANKELVNDGYDHFVKPIEQILTEEI